MSHKSAVFLLLLFPILCFAEQQLSQVELTKLEKVLGRSGTALPGGVQRYSWPRTDLEVRLEGVLLDPAIGVTSWAAFKKTGATEVMVMGDLALRSSELNSVIEELRSGRIEILAIHNHLLGENPQIIYVHYAAHGMAEQLAGVIQKALIKTKTPLQAKSTSQNGKQINEKSFELIQRVLGKKGNVSGTVLQMSFPRAEKISTEGHGLPPSMGMANVMNFQAVGQNVATTGDFVLLAEEVNPVVTELQANGLNVTALHNHMLNETPRLFFMHFWAMGDPEKVANGLKAALGKIKTR